MLLYRVAKEGGLGAQDDPRPPGVHVEGVCESWGEKRKAESGRLEAWPGVWWVLPPRKVWLEETSLPWGVQKPCPWGV